MCIFFADLERRTAAPTFTPDPSLENFFWGQTILGTRKDIAMYEKYIRPVRRFLGHYKRRLEALPLSLKNKMIRQISVPLKLIPGGTEEAIAYLNGNRSFTPELVIMSYCQGMFQLGEEGNRVIWENPSMRSVIYLQDLAIPRRLRRDYRKNRDNFEVRFNTAFEEVMRNCAQRKTTWITETIIETWVELHHMGLAHSSEAWQGGKLVGGTYGLTLGSYYAGESMFHTVSEASKVALIDLMKALQGAGITLFDTQVLTNYFKRYGAIEIPQEEFQKELALAITAPVRVTLPEFPEEDEIFEEYHLVPV